MKHWSVGLVGLLSISPASHLHLLDGEPQHLSEARQLVANLKGIKDNVYAKGSPHIDWGIKNPSARTVCSSFLTLLLQHSYRLNDNQIVGLTGKSNPKASDYYNSVNSTSPFAQVKFIKDVQPGDLIFLKYTDGHLSRDGAEDTGHVMLINSVPQRVPNPALVDDELETWSVEVIDSSASGHGPTDTRYLGKGKFTGGIGKGTAQLLFAPDTGLVAGYCWSDLAHSEPYFPPDRLITIARFQPPK